MAIVAQYFWQLIANGATLQVDATTSQKVGNQLPTALCRVRRFSKGWRVLIDMLRGQLASRQAVTEAVKRAGVASAATAITTYLFS